MPYFSVQFQPGHIAETNDTDFLFDLFMKYVTFAKKGEYYDLYNQIYYNDKVFDEQDALLRPEKILLLGSGELSCVSFHYHK